MNEQDLIDKFDKVGKLEKLAFASTILEKSPELINFRLEIIGYYLQQKESKTAVKFLPKLSKNINRLQKIKLAQFSLRTKSYKLAEECTAQLLDKNTKDVQGHLLQGDLFLARDNIKSALQSYQKALDINISSVGAISKSQRILIELGDIKQAKSNLEKAINSKPNNFHLNIREGELWVEGSEYPKAAKSFNRALRLANNIKLSVMAIQSLIKAQSYYQTDEQIISNLKEFIIEFPEQELLKFKLLNLLSKSGRLDESIQIIDDILKTNPNNLRAREQQSRVLYRLGDYKEAEKLLLALISDQPPKAIMMVHLANIYTKTNRENLAAEYYQRCIELEPGLSNAYVHFAQFLYSEGDSNSALKLLSKGMYKVKNKYGILIKTININMHLGNNTLALQLVEDSMKKYSVNAELLILKAKILQRLGDFEGSIEYAKKVEYVESISKKSLTDAKKVIADTYFMMYNYEASETVFRELTTLIKVPNFERNRLALLLALKGDDLGAMEQLKIATEEVQNENGKVLIPLIGHSAKVINELRINPRLLANIKSLLTLEGEARIESLAKLNLESPNYFGTSLFLANELRSQGILEELSASLGQNKSKTQIPRVIIQYWNEDRPPNEILNTMSSWRKHNPEYVHKVYSRNTAWHFIKENYGKREAEAFINCEHPAMQADYFRLAYLSKKGGFYADADDKCRRSLDNLVDKGAELIIKLGDFGCFSNNFLACVPNSPHLGYALERGTENMLTYFNEGPWFRLGPGHLTSCLSYIFAQNIHLKDYDSWPRILVLGQSEFRVFVSQHLSLSYKRGDKSWFSSEYKKTITKAKSA